MYMIKNPKQNPSIAIVAAEYHKEIVDSLVTNCVDTLVEADVAREDIKLVRVPGALEIPLTAQKLATAGNFDAIIVFGIILRGDTYHFEQVSNECARGCIDVGLKTGVPVIFQVLSVNSIEDAIERVQGTTDNRGVEGARTALKMVSILNNL